MNVRRAVNCGGEAYGDFEKDLPVIPAPRNRGICLAAISMRTGRTRNSGSRAALEIAAIFQEQDGKLPRPVQLGERPGRS